MSGARVLLLGGGGFLGGATARALRGAGHRVTVLARSGRPLPDADATLRADRADAASLAAALENQRFDFTVDFLAFDAPDLERLFLVPHAALGRYVMISTGQVYLVTEGARPPYRERDGAGPLEPEPAAGTYDHVQWSYGAGKRRAEQTLRSLRAADGVRATILRLPIVHGAGDRSLRLWAWLERILDGGPVLLPEGGARPVRFLWAEDLGRAILRLLEGEPPREVAYNLAPPDALTLREYLEMVARVAGVTPRWVDVSWGELEDAGLDPTCAPHASRWSSLLDPTLAAAELGFAGTRMADALPGIVRDYLERRPAGHHPGYARRAAERALAERILGSAVP